MYKYITIVFAIAACGTAKPAVLTPLSFSALAGTSQVDIRSNFNGGYSTALGYTAPLSARIAPQVIPFGYTAKYASPALAAPLSYTAPIARYTPSLAGAAYATPYGAAYTPYAGGYAAPFTTGYGAQYSLAAPATAPVFL